LGVQVVIRAGAPIAKIRLVVVTVQPVVGGGAVERVVAG